jgi:hypothetical protein
VGVRKKALLFEKKQKLFANLGGRWNSAYLNEQKFFGSFFQKRTASFVW